MAKGVIQYSWSNPFTEDDIMSEKKKDSIEVEKDMPNKPMFKGGLGIPDDLWAGRDTHMRCETCMHYANMRCRRHAPTMQGYPAVFPHDWCGDHKLSKGYMKTM